MEVTISGKKEVTKVKLSEEVVDPDDIEMLEDLIVAATNEALRKVEEAASSAMVPRNGRRSGILQDVQRNQPSRSFRGLLPLLSALHDHHGQTPLPPRSPCS